MTYSAKEWLVYAAIAGVIVYLVYAQRQASPPTSGEQVQSGAGPVAPSKPQAIHDPAGDPRLLPPPVGKVVALAPVKLPSGAISYTRTRNPTGASLI